MKHWSNALFPLTLLLTLTGLTIWLRYVTEQPEVRSDGKHRHDPDYIVHDATLRKIGQSGRLEYTLKADTVLHYPDDDSLEFFKPNLIYTGDRNTGKPGPAVTVTADTGRVSENNERLDLDGNVQIHRAASGKRLAMVGTTSTLTVFPNEEKAFTKAPVLVTEGGSWAKGVGMQMNLRDEKYTIESQARAMLESRRARK